MVDTRTLIVYKYICIWEWFHCISWKILWFLRAFDIVNLDVVIFDYMKIYFVKTGNTFANTSKTNYTIWRWVFFSLNITCTSLRKYGDKVIKDDYLDFYSVSTKLILPFVRASVRLTSISIFHRCTSKNVLDRLFSSAICIRLQINCRHICWCHRHRHWRHLRCRPYILLEWSVTRE